MDCEGKRAKYLIVQAEFPGPLQIADIFIEPYPAQGAHLDRRLGVKAASDRTKKPKPRISFFRLSCPYVK